LHIRLEVVAEVSIAEAVLIKIIGATKSREDRCV